MDLLLAYFLGNRENMEKRPPLNLLSNEEDLTGENEIEIDLFKEGK
ncbi:MAG: hypothetical protein V5A79_05665 [Candidatus Bipolaricaulota bacterium]